MGYQIDGSVAHSFGHHFSCRSFQNCNSRCLNPVSCECQRVSLLAFLLLRLLEQGRWPMRTACCHAYASKTPPPSLYSSSSIEGYLFQTHQPSMEAGAQL